MSITLRAARVNQELTQKQAADRLGVTIDVVSNWERYKTFPNVLMIKKIEELYKVKYDDIIFLPRKSD